MSQSSREPQSKWRPPVVAPDAAPSAAEAPAGAEVPASGPSASPAVPVSPAVPPPPAPAVPVAPAAPPPPARVAPDFSVAPPPPAPVFPPSSAAVRPNPAPYPAAVDPAAIAPSLRPAAGADSLTDDFDTGEEKARTMTLQDRLRGLSPALATLAVGSIGSALFLALAMTSHTTPVAVLMSAGVVTALVFALDTVICSVATYRAGQNEESGRALVFALVGGVSAVICALALAGTLIMILVLNR